MTTITKHGCLNKITYKPLSFLVSYSPLTICTPLTRLSSFCCKNCFFWRIHRYLSVSLPTIGRVGKKRGRRKKGPRRREENGGTGEKGKWSERKGGGGRGESKRTQPLRRAVIFFIFTLHFLCLLRLFWWWRFVYFFILFLAYLFLCNHTLEREVASLCSLSPTCVYTRTHTRQIMGHSQVDMYQHAVDKRKIFFWEKDNRTERQIARESIRLCEWGIDQGIRWEQRGWDR